ncbi:hypothetical protein I552_3982 [Mycobacterium xenopi 3993]|nr:hypothetical protein I552_3982 [Mycobacterium xenopi 3993]
MPRQQVTAQAGPLDHVHGRAVFHATGLAPSSLAQKPRSSAPNGSETHTTGVLPTMAPTRRYFSGAGGTYHSWGRTGAGWNETPRR